MQKDLLWGDYIELLAHARHAETVRTNAINFVSLLTSALVALITVDKRISHADLAPSLIISSLGAFSAIFSLSYTERYSRNKRRAVLVRRELDRRFFHPADGLTDLRAAPDTYLLPRKAGRRKRAELTLYRWARKVTGTTHLFWVMMPMFVLLIGILLTALSLVQVAVD